MKRNSVVFFVMLLIFFASQGKVQQAEARMCQSGSHNFHGTCLSNHNCAMVCRNEGFSGGHCIGFRRRCFCTRSC
ncbi:Defensin-like protein 6 [Bienertia sinuspersici]